MKKVLQAITIAFVTLSLVACNSGQKVKTEKSATKIATGQLVYFEAHHDGRINVFDDTKTYLSFLSLGETSYRLTRIGAGPKGESVVFGLTKKDKKKRSGIKSVDMFDGKLKPSGAFYGEILQHNRHYVFNTWDDMMAVKKTGEAAYRYTLIGAGPKGKTVVFVLNKGNKKKKPIDLIAQFKKVHGI